MLPLKSYDKARKAIFRSFLRHLQSYTQPRSVSVTLSGPRCLQRVAAPDRLFAFRTIFRLSTLPTNITLHRKMMHGNFCLAASGTMFCRKLKITIHRLTYAFIFPRSVDKLLARAQVGPFDFHNHPFLKTGCYGFVQIARQHVQI